MDRLHSEFSEFDDLFLTNQALDVLPSHERAWLNYLYSHGSYPAIKNTVQQMVSGIQEGSDLVPWLRTSLEHIIQIRVQDFFDITEVLKPEEIDFLKENWKNDPELLPLVEAAVLAWAKADPELPELVKILKQQTALASQKRKAALQEGMKNFKENEGIELFMKLANQIAGKLAAAPGREEYEGFSDDLGGLQVVIGVLNPADIRRLVLSQISIKGDDVDSKATRRGFRKLATRIGVNLQKPR